MTQWWFKCGISSSVKWVFPHTCPPDPSQGVLCQTQLCIHPGCQPVCQWAPQDHEPEGNGATLLPIRPHHHFPHPGGPGHRSSHWRGCTWWGAGRRHQGGTKTEIRGMARQEAGEQEEVSPAGPRRARSLKPETFPVLSLQVTQT